MNLLLYSERLDMSYISVIMLSVHLWLSSLLKSWR